jgi:hypothetical protein
MFSGLSSKMFSEMKAPPPHPPPTDISNYGIPYSLWIPDEYGDPMPLEPHRQQRDFTL